MTFRAHALCSGASVEATSAPAEIRLHLFTAIATIHHNRICMEKKKSEIRNKNINEKGS